VWTRAKHKNEKETNMTNLERAQVTELQIRLAGYGRLADVATSDDDMRRAIRGIKEIRRQLAEIMSRVEYRKLHTLTK
jgi:hypothetical protein